jgi:hypothetical protein
MKLQETLSLSLAPRLRRELLVLTCKSPRVNFSKNEHLMVCQSRNYDYKFDEASPQISIKMFVAVTQIYCQKKVENSCATRIVPRDILTRN